MSGFGRESRRSTPPPLLAAGGAGRERAPAFYLSRASFMKALQAPRGRRAKSFLEVLPRGRSSCLFLMVVSCGRYSSSFLAGDPVVDPRDGNVCGGPSFWKFAGICHVDSPLGHTLRGNSGRRLSKKEEGQERESSIARIAQWVSPYHYL